MINSRNNDTKVIENRSIHTYMWNPDWDKFQHLSLEDKIQAFKLFILQSQEDFKNTSLNDSTAVCLLVAPDLVFSPPRVSSIPEVYSFEDHLHFFNRLTEFSNKLDDSRILIIAGAIPHLTANNENFKVTSYILSQNKISSYDKKIASETLNIDGKIIEMEKGAKSGLIHFQNIDIGLEICRDHEKRTLLNELKGKFVDIHVLICNTQNIRAEAIATNLKSDSLLIVNELESGKLIKRLNKNEVSTCYKTTSAKIRQSVNSDNAENNWRLTNKGMNSKLLGNAITRDLEPLPKTKTLDITYSSVVIPVEKIAEPINKQILIEKNAGPIAKNSSTFYKAENDEKAVESSSKTYRTEMSWVVCSGWRK